MRKLLIIRFYDVGRLQIFSNILILLGKDRSPRNRNSFRQKFQTRRRMRCSITHCTIQSPVGTSNTARHPDSRSRPGKLSLYDVTILRGFIKYFSISSRNNIRYSLQDIRVNVCVDQWLSGRESFSDFFYYLFYYYFCRIYYSISTFTRFMLITHLYL